MSIGKRIKLSREKLYYTQEDLARKVQFTHSTLITYEIGLSIPKGEILVKLAEVLKISTGYLLGCTNAGETPEE